MIELEKYKGLSTRYTCPKCGRNRCFTKYIDTETNQYIDNSVGICNHRNSCGYHLSPSTFFETNPEKRKEGYVNNFFDENRVKEIIAIESIPNELVLKYMGLDSKFLTFLKSKFDKDIVRKAILDYMIGGFGDGKVVFNQIDSMGRVRSAKLILYNETTGKRFRNAENEYNENGTRNSFSPPVEWLHTSLKKDGLISKDFKLTQCLFGEHLHGKYPEKKIIVVESEKTAIVMSCYNSDYVYMATGGLGGLNSQRIFPIKDAEIIVFPDYGQFEYWKQKADMINHELGSNVMVSDTFEKIAKEQDLEIGCDIADFYLEANNKQTIDQ
ncbi:MAG: DUF6371 domain-containing protein [Bacteroidales bacterium]